jgi:hypothetical protein
MHAALGGLGMAQALQPEDEEDRGEQITEFNEVGLPDHNELSADYADFTDSKKLAKKGTKGSKGIFEIGTTRSKTAFDFEFTFVLLVPFRGCYFLSV